MPTANAPEDPRRWYLVDAEGQILGRMAARVARVLMGKHKPVWAPHLDVGDFVVITNAKKIAVTGRKMTDKIYYAHSGYPGGLKAANLQRMLMKHPAKVIYHAVWGMLPHNRLGRQMLRKLKVYGGPDHPHQAQQPQPLEFNH
jgi:large subunit ribosomal protein L13